MYLIKVYYKANGKLVKSYYSTDGKEKFLFGRAYQVVVEDLRPKEVPTEKEYEIGKLMPTIRIV